MHRDKKKVEQADFIGQATPDDIRLETERVEVELHARSVLYDRAAEQHLRASRDKRLMVDRVHNSTTSGPLISFGALDVDKLLEPDLWENTLNDTTN